MLGIPSEPVIERWAASALDGARGTFGAAGDALLQLRPREAERGRKLPATDLPVRAIDLAARLSRQMTRDWLGKPTCSALASGRHGRGRHGAAHARPGEQDAPAMRGTRISSKSHLVPTSDRSLGDAGLCMGTHPAAVSHFPDSR